MPRKMQAARPQPRPHSQGLVEQLAAELKSNRESGQPMVYEHPLPAGTVRVVVFWDKWDRMPLDERTDVVLRAYEAAEGREYRQKIALARGLTIPEGHAAGMLPFQILTALRRGDPVTLEQCRQAMLDEGASTLLSPEEPQLRFPTEDDAEACRSRLIKRLPGSEPVWIINRELIARDFGTGQDWAAIEEQ